MLASNLPFEGQRILEAGAHEGGLSLFAVEAGGRAVCSDRQHAYSAAQTVLHRAWDVHPQHVTADVCDLPFRSNSVDIVMLKSVLGGIIATGGALAAQSSFLSIHRVLRSGGAIVILEQLEGDPLSRRIRRTLFPHRHWHYFTPPELLALLSSFRVQTVRHETVLSHLTEGRVGSAHVFVRGALWADRFLEYVIPTRWTHLIGIVAVKI
jgi:ubiquinone/menaquinone biosynthesis C-methylase UbiE